MNFQFPFGSEPLVNGQSVKHFDDVRSGRLRSATRRRKE
jgi:hypothetical protein